MQSAVTNVSARMGHSEELAEFNCCAVIGCHCQVHL